MCYCAFRRLLKSMQPLAVAERRKLFVSVEANVWQAHVHGPGRIESIHASCTTCTVSKIQLSKFAQQQHRLNLPKAQYTPPSNLLCSVIFVNFYNFFSTMTSLCRHLSVVSTGNCKLGHDCRRVCSHRRRDATRQFRLVGVGGVYWA